MGVNATLDHFEAASEFSSPHFENDTCGEAAFLMIEHCRDGAGLTGDAVYHVREDMAAKGFAVAGGTTMGELVTYFKEHRGLDVVYANGYGDSWEHIHQTLLEHAGRDGVVIEVERAYALTGNEGGVRRHYVAIGGIHPTLGYLVGNGDDVLALAQHDGHGKVIPARWMDHTVIERARPSACAVIRGLAHTIHDAQPQPQPQPVPAPQPTPAPLPRYFDEANIVALRSELVQAIQAAQSNLEVLQKALASLPAVPQS